MPDPAPVLLERFDFSTADSETAPEFTYDGTTLTMRFRDWRGRSVTSVFRDAVGFRWSAECSLHSSLLDDGAYEIRGSQWIADLSAASQLTDGLLYRHLII